MPYTLRVALCLLSLSLSFVGPARARAQTVSKSLAASEVNKPAALNAQAPPRMRRGDYAEALRISQLAARLAEGSGEGAALGEALHNMGLIHNRQNRAAEALDFLQK